MPAPITLAPAAPTHAAHAGDGDCLPAGNAQERLRWAQLLERVFDIDIEHYSHCGGQLQLIAGNRSDSVEIRRDVLEKGAAMLNESWFVRGCVRV